jgi:hypothetical protein
MDESNWQKQLLLGVVMLLVVGGLIGVVVAVAGLKAADLAGIGETKHTTRSNERLHIPRHVGTTTPLTSQGPTTGSAQPTRPTASKPPRHHPFSLTASPASVSTFQRINLTGLYNAPNGTSLQVQRKENGVWADFPTSARVSDNRFATYVETGHTGLNVFRVTDPASARSSNVATVTVH